MSKKEDKLEFARGSTVRFYINDDQEMVGVVLSVDEDHQAYTTRHAGVNYNYVVLCGDKKYIVEPFALWPVESKPFIVDDNFLSDESWKEDKNDV